ncbi:MAG: VanZ family protein, partial [Myxococcota bacterium]
GPSAVRIAWVLAVAAAFCAATLSLREAPEEALHFVEYGVLGVLAWRALRPSLPDAGVFLGAALVGIIVGILDEAIQWATPQRYWGLRDVGFNAFAAALVQLALAGGFDPASARRPLAPASVRRVCGLAAIAWVLLCASFLNTPPRTRWLAAHVPGLDSGSDHLMAEYGRLHDDPRVGRFRSRLELETLHAQDAARAAEVAVLLDGYPHGADYPRFMAEYPASRDAFVHEMRVHLFRRDRYRDQAGRSEDPGAGRAAARVALAEQRILERHFGRSLAASGFRLGADERAALEQAAGTDSSYESPVSGDLLTRFREDQVLPATLLGLLALGGLVWRFGHGKGRTG